MEFYMVNSLGLIHQIKKKIVWVLCVAWSLRNEFYSLWYITSVVCYVYLNFWTWSLFLKTIVSWLIYLSGTSFPDYGFILLQPVESRWWCNGNSSSICFRFVLFNITQFNERRGFLFTLCKVEFKLMLWSSKCFLALLFYLHPWSAWSTYNAMY